MWGSKLILIQIAQIHSYKYGHGQISIGLLKWGSPHEICGMWGREKNVFPGNYMFQEEKGRACTEHAQFNLPKFIHHRTIGHSLSLDWSV